MHSVQYKELVLEPTRTPDFEATLLQNG